MSGFKLPEEVAGMCVNFLAGREDAAAAVAACLKNSRAAVMKAHLQGVSGRAVCAATTAAVDEVIKFLWKKFLARRLKKDGRIGEKVCVVALGGYGRRELCPNSDVDILFLYEDGVGDKIK